MKLRSPLMPTFPKPDRKLLGPATWRGEQLSKSDEWVHRLTPTEINELEDALATVRAAKRPLDRVRRDGFPLRDFAFIFGDDL